jgi:integrase
MRGAVLKRGKTYSYVVPLERDPETGAKRQKWVGGFRTKRECEDALNDALSRVRAGTFSVEGSRTTVKQFAADWLAAVEPTVRPSTFASYRMVIEKYVVPRLGRLKLSALTAGHLSRFYNELGATGSKTGGPLSPTTVRYAHTVLGRALEDAVAWGLVPRNVARVAKPPRKASTDMKVWSPEEARRFVEAARGDRLFALWFLLLTTGLRRGEAVGLRWADIDLDRSVMSVRRTIASVDGEMVEMEPKTAKSRRSVALDAATVKALRAHRKRQEVERRLVGEGWIETGAVFAYPDGRPLHPDHVMVVFRRLVADAGLPLIRLHDLRHTAATLALAAGVHPKVVQERLGHSSIGITLDTYSHVIEGMQADAASKVAQLLLSPEGRGDSEASR